MLVSLEYTVTGQILRENQSPSGSERGSGRAGRSGEGPMWATPTTFVSGELEKDLRLRANQDAACK